MTEDQIENMLRDLVLELDYDLYKEVFTYPSDYDLSFRIRTLKNIIKGYLGTHND